MKNKPVKSCIEGSQLSWISMVNRVRSPLSKVHVSSKWLISLDIVLVLTICRIICTVRCSYHSCVKFFCRIISSFVIFERMNKINIIFFLSYLTKNVCTIRCASRISLYAAVWNENSFILISVLLYEKCNMCTNWTKVQVLNISGTTH